MAKGSDTEYKRKVAENYVNIVSSGDMAAIKAMYADDAILEDPVGTPVRAGIEAICEFYQQGFDIGVKLTLSGPVRCCGNAAAFPFKLEMTGMEIDVIDVFEFNDAGEIISMKAYWGME